MIFNIIIGNNDAHAKNFSFLIDGHGKVGLTPAYDLVCTQLYEDLRDTFAMTISGKGSVEALQIGDIEALFNNLHKKKYKTLKPTLMKYADNSLKSIQQEVEKFEQGNFYNIDIKNFKRIGEIASANHALLTEKL